MTFGIGQNNVSCSSFGIPTGLSNCALSFATVTDIRDVNIRIAPQVLMNNLSGNGLSDKTKAIYPFVSDGYINSRATQHKYNLMNPADTDAAFRLTFSGGWTHSSTGALPNGTTGYANTYLNPNSLLSINSNHQSFYSRTNSAAAIRADIGGLTVSSYWVIFPLFAATFYGGLMTAAYVTAAATRSDGYFSNCRTASNAAAIYRNGTSQATSIVASSALLNGNVFIGAANDSGAANYYANREIAFATLGSGLDATDNTNLNSLVTTFQTALSRNI